MDAQTFSRIRRRLGKTQRELAQLTGSSLKSIQGYEQGWRRVPCHVGRQALFLLARLENRETRLANCWERKNCPVDLREHCPAWEFGAGRLCWFISGTICQGQAQPSWEEKMKICLACEVLDFL